ncbi:MAG: hypothetical protein MMC23_003494 [Stictis urceolatum]|nr:hypothetical protein [Stictis urceolata]
MSKNPKSAYGTQLNQLPHTNTNFAVSVKDEQMEDTTEFFKKTSHWHSVLITAVQRPCRDLAYW